MAPHCLEDKALCLSCNALTSSLHTLGHYSWPPT